MAKGRSFLAAMQRQAAASAREHARNVREAERAQKARERLAAQMARASAADQKRLEKEAREEHIAEMEEEAEIRNSELAEVYEAIDSMLKSTLTVDHVVDILALRSSAEHPMFDRTDLETPIPSPKPIPDPLEPIFTPPAPPSGLLKMFGKKKHETAVSAAEVAHQQAVIQWRQDLIQAEASRKAAEARHAGQEAARIEALGVERARYEAECAAREQAAIDRNNALETLHANLAYGTKDAVEEYLSIVFSNTLYPEYFPVEHDFEFDGTSAELRLRVLVPGPDKVPTTNAYKYMKSSDEITSTTLSQKACKDRYAGAVHQVALRSLYEVFTADRRGLIKTISLEVGTEAIEPATGLEAYIPFVAAGAERSAFLALDLANVVPSATLSHLGAAVSKNPYELVAAVVSGVRRT
ncbi:MAG: hypothetical protein M5R41_06815 [Bacteroidia bacterium]|nr:hypothetical protein [Bacteroidia bacterium]